MIFICFYFVSDLSVVLCLLITKFSACVFLYHPSMSVKCPDCPQSQSNKHCRNGFFFSLLYNQYFHFNKITLNHGKSKTDTVDMLMEEKTCNASNKRAAFLKLISHCFHIFLSFPIPCQKQNVKSAKWYTETKHHVIQLLKQTLRW